MSEIMWVQRKVIFDNNNSPNSQSALAVKDKCL